MLRTVSNTSTELRYISSMNVALGDEDLDLFYF